MEEMRMNLKKKMQSRAASEVQAETSSSSMTEKRSPNTQEEEQLMQVNVTSTCSNAEKDMKTQQHELTQTKATLQYIDRWFDTPVPNITREGDNDALGHRRRHTSNNENDYYTDEDNNIAMMRKNRDFSYEHLHVNKKISSDSEASEWQAVSESSDFEILEKS